MSTDAGTVLIVDDVALNVDLLEQELGAAGYRTLAASRAETALALAVRELPDLILLDVRMVGIDGFEACRRLKASEATRAIPVIFLTALAETFDKVRAFRIGAVDYVTKPFESEELLARVGAHIALRRETEAHRRPRATIRELVDKQRHEGDAMVGESAALQQVRELIAQVAPTDSTVLILGETGTGKERVARAIHEQGPRCEGPLVCVNCAALPRELIESELFGHEKGAFTGALQQRRGRFEIAAGGTLLLDEVGELPLEAQSKLLRVLQEREIERVGGTRSVRVDVRVIAATNRDLHAELAAGRFRADLFYRLNVFPITVPPLRERREDIPLLVRHFATQAARRLGRAADAVDAAFLQRACAHDWPGNLRELENAVERVLISSRGGATVGADAWVTTLAPAAPTAKAHATLEAVERGHIRLVLDDRDWRIEGASGAAQTLGLNPSTLRGRMRKLGLHKNPMTHLASALAATAPLNALLGAPLRLQIDPLARTVVLDGVPVMLGGRVFDLLALLASRPGWVFTVDELLAGVWPQRVVVPNNLRVQIKALRKCLGNGLVQNVAGRGYVLAHAADVLTHAACVPAGMPPHVGREHPRRPAAAEPTTEIFRATIPGLSQRPDTPI